LFKPFEWQKPVFGGRNPALDAVYNDWLNSGPGLVHSWHTTNLFPVW